MQKRRPLRMRGEIHRDLRHHTPSISFKQIHSEIEEQREMLAEIFMLDQKVVVGPSREHKSGVGYGSGVSSRDNVIPLH